MADDNGADMRTSLRNQMRTALKVTWVWTGQDGCEGSGRRTARCVMVDGACGAGGNKVEYKEN